MTPEQALQLLGQVTAGIETTRDNHSKIIAALEVLKKAITPVKEPGLALPK